MSVSTGKVEGMASWADVQRTAPEFASAVAQTFAIRKHATMATIQRDGTPRISGTEVDFDDDGQIYLGMMTGAKRADDLRRDPRVAIHCPTEDPPPDDPEAWPGDGKITARAVEVESHRFRLDIERVVLTRVHDGGLQISIWRPPGKVDIVRRD